MVGFSGFTYRYCVNTKQTYEWEPVKLPSLLHVRIYRTDGAAVAIQLLDGYAITAENIVKPLRIELIHTPDAEAEILPTHPEGKDVDSDEIIPMATTPPDASASIHLWFDAPEATMLLVRSGPGLCGCAIVCNGDKTSGPFVIKDDHSLRMIPLVVPRIPGRPRMVRYIRLRRGDLKHRPVELASVHVCSTDYTDPEARKVHFHPRATPDKKIAIENLLVYSNYSFATTDPATNAFIELDYGTNIPVYTVTLITRPSVLGCFLEYTANLETKKKKKQHAYRSAVSRDVRHQPDHRFLL